MNTLYSTEVTSTGCRTGTVASSDGRLTLTLDTVKELGGAGGAGTNPEQLFAAGYAACFIGSLKYLAGQQKLTLSNETSVTATVGIGQRDDGQGFGLAIALSISLPGLTREDAEALVAQADVVCPYSHLAHHGADVTLSVA